MNLALKYRPKDFSDVVGQKAISVILQAMIAKNKLEQVLLFTGPSGVGKTSMARIIAAQLNSEGATDVHQGTHPAVLEIDAASNGSVEAIRNLKKSLRYAIAGHRVVILDEVHAISDAAWSALLHLLEFPPENVTIILITTEFHKIPKTILHRCDRYDFKRASVEDLVLRLKQVTENEGLNQDIELLNLIAQRSEGSYRESLMLLNQLANADVTTVEQFNSLHGDVDFGPVLIKSALEGPISAVNQLTSTLKYTNFQDIADRTIETLRDIMLISAGLPVDATNIGLEQRQELADKLTTDQILKAMRIIWDLQTKLSNIDPVRGLEMAFSLLGEVLQVQMYSSAPATSAQRMSFAEMQNRRLTSQ